MIQFNTIEISADGNTLTINASVKDLSYYTNVYIKSINIDNQDTYVADGPSSNPLYKETFAENKKSINISLNAKDIDKETFNDDIWYVYLIATGTPSSDVPCGMDNKITLGVAINIQNIYNLGMQYIKQVENACEMSKGFIDFILKYKALDIALKTKHYTQANKYWNKFFKGTLSTTVNTANCGCS